MADDDGNSTSQSAVPSQSSNLYLVTFLATLFLLLFVSCAIVLRSFVLRRRYNRRLQEAMAQGIFLSPRAQGSKRKRFGARPGFVERWIEPAGGAGWARTMPLYAQPVYVKRRVRGVDRTSLSNGPNGVPSSPVAASGTTPTVPHPQPTRGLLNALPSLQFRRPRIDFLRRLNGLPARDPPPRRASGNAANGNAVVGNGIEGAGTGSPAAPPGYKIRVEMMQVAVLITMPDARKPAWKTHAGGKGSFDTDFDDDRKDLTDEEGDEEEEEPVLPELVFGLTRVAYRQTKDKVPTAPTAPTTRALAPLDLATSAPLSPNPNSNSTPNTPATANATANANTPANANNSNTPAPTQGRTQGRTRARAQPQDQSQTSTDQMNLVEALQTASQKEREREARGRRQTAVEVYESLVAAAAAAEGGNAHTHSAGSVSAASHPRGPPALIDLEQETGLDPDDEDDGVEVDLDLELQEDGVIVSETEPEDDLDLDGEGEAYLDSEADVEAQTQRQMSTIRAP